MSSNSTHESIERLASCLEALADGVAIVDTNGRQIWVNGTFCEMVGWTRSELIGCEAPHLYWPPEELDGIYTSFRQTLDGGPKEFELVFMRKNGERFPASVHPALAELDGEQVYVATIKDISELRARARKHEATKDFLQTLLSAGDMASWEWHVTEGWAKVSDSYFTLLGYEPNAWNASYEEWAKRVHPDDIGGADRNMQLLLTDQTRLYEAEHRMLDVNGEWRWVLARGHVTERTVDGEPARIVGTMQEIHRLKTQERKLQQFQQMELLGALASGLAHDFRNLIFVIGANIEAARTAPPDELSRYHDRVDVAVDLAGKLVESLLQRVGTAIPEVKPVEVGGFLAATRDLIGSTLPPNVTLSIDSGDEPSTGMLDRRALELSLMNLVINSRDAIGAEGGTVRIRVRPENISRGVAAEYQVSPGPYVIVSVSDDGDGMTPDVLERAAEPLFSTKSASRGTGLGLSMARKFAADCGGFLRLESVAEEGTTVEMAFPLCVELHETPVSITPAARSCVGAGETILVVDDQAEILEVVESFLKSLQYEVITAGNPRQALALIRVHPVDLLLTDIVMPFTLDGIDLARAARNLNKGLPVLFMTAFLDQEQRVSTQPIGAVLRKPFTIDELAASIRAELSVSAITPTA